jgi:hypothetical protein
MKEKVDKVARLLQANLELDRQLERLDDVKTLAEIIHHHRENRRKESSSLKVMRIKAARLFPTRQSANHYAAQKDR